MPSGLGHAAIVVATLAAGMPGVAAPLLRFDQQLIAPDSEPGDLFGKTVDLDGEFAMVRSREDYISVAVRGPQTHVFRQSPSGAWSQAGVTVHAIGSDQYALGRSAALDGGVIINGQVTKTNGGSRYSALEDVTFTNAATAPSGVSTAPFPFDAPLHPRDPANPFVPGYLERTVGRAVAISGDIAAANDMDYQLSFGGSGSLHLYERSSTGAWEWSARLTPETRPDLSFGERLEFGYEIALDGPTAMVTTRSHTPYVYFFVREGPGQWRETALLDLTQAAPNAGWELLGVALDGDTAVVRGNSYSELDSGAVAILNRMADDSWEVVQAFEARLRVRAGRRVAIEGDLIALGTDGSEEHPESLVQLYQRNATGVWDLKQTLRSPDPRYDTSFGSSLALDNGRLLIGASAEDDTLASPGAAFLYVAVPEPAGAASVACCLASLFAARAGLGGAARQRRTASERSRHDN